MQIKTGIKPREKTGAKDGAHYLLECSVCSAPLVDIWVTYPNADVECNFVAECPHCGNKSYQQKVKGLCVIGGTPESLKYTQPIYFDMDQDPVIIKTEQVKPFKVTT